MNWKLNKWQRIPLVILCTPLQSTPYSILLCHFVCLALLIEEHILIQLITIRVFVVDWSDNFSSAFMYTDVTQLKEVPYWKGIITLLHSPPGSTERLVTGSAYWYNPATSGQAPTAGRSKYVFHSNCKLCNKELISNKWSIIFWQEIKDGLPAPDIRPLEDRLNYLKKNIFKSLPNSRLTSKTDSPAYSRAATHVLAFKVQDSVHLPLVFAFEDSLSICCSLQACT